MYDSTSTEKAFEQAAAFQKIWMETFTKMAQSGFSLTPDSTPPELLRQMRSGIFQALSKSWEEFMRSPQFLESMKAMMESAINFRKMGNDLLTQAHHSLQGTAQADIDQLMLSIRHMETRILDRIEEVSARLDRLEEPRAGANQGGGGHAARKASGPQRQRPIRKGNAARAGGQPA